MEQIFYLNLGEPFFSPTICQELPLLREKNPEAYIVVSTNGVLLNTDAKREAALNLSDIQFSVHGISDEMCEKYMIRSNFEKAYAAMRDMVAYRNARGLRGADSGMEISFVQLERSSETHRQRHRNGEGDRRGHHFVLADEQSVLRHVMALSARASLKMSATPAGKAAKLISGKNFRRAEVLLVAEIFGSIFYATPSNPSAIIARNQINMKTFAAILFLAGPYACRRSPTRADHLQPKFCRRARHRAARFESRRERRDLFRRNRAGRAGLGDFPRPGGQTFAANPGAKLSQRSCLAGIAALAV